MVRLRRALAQATPNSRLVPSLASRKRVYRSRSRPPATTVRTCPVSHGSCVRSWGAARHQVSSWSVRAYSTGAQLVMAGVRHEPLAEIDRGAVQARPQQARPAAARLAEGFGRTLPGQDTRTLGRELTPTAPIPHNPGLPERDLDLLLPGRAGDPLALTSVMFGVKVSDDGEQHGLFRPQRVDGRGVDQAVLGV